MNTKIDLLFLVMKDKTLSWKAKGIFSYLATKPTKCQVSMDRLRQLSKDGAGAMKSGIKELKTSGYLRHEMQRRGHSFTGVKWFICDPADNSKATVI